MISPQSHLRRNRIRGPIKIQDGMLDAVLVLLLVQSYTYSLLTLFHTAENSGYDPINLHRAH